MNRMDKARALATQAKRSAVSLLIGAVSFGWLIGCATAFPGAPHQQEIDNATISPPLSKTRNGVTVTLDPYMQVERMQQLFNRKKIASPNGVLPVYVEVINNGDCALEMDPALTWVLSNDCSVDRQEPNNVSVSIVPWKKKMSSDSESNFAKGGLAGGGMAAGQMFTTYKPAAPTAGIVGFLLGGILNDAFDPARTEISYKPKKDVAKVDWIAEQRALQGKVLAPGESTSGFVYFTFLLFDVPKEQRAMVKTHVREFGIILPICGVPISAPDAERRLVFELPYK